MKKLNVFTCLFYGTVIAGCTYLGFFLGSIIHPGMTLYTFVPALKEQMANPLKIKVTACTPYTMAAVFLMAVLSIMVQKTNWKNYRFGKEHGSARWADAAMLIKQLGDKDNYHRILSQNLRLSMNTRKTMRNNNIFCIGGSGAGKSMFLIGLLYEQLMQELYFQADTKHGGRLPIHVSMYLDEFYNTPLPDSYLNFLSTMRSREISNVIVVQNIAQVKELFKDGWETVPGNADTLVYLGGNESSSHKYISELLGKSTIDKRSSGETLGKRGSSSRNYDVLGRELMTPDEVRKLDNKKCIVLIRGCDPVIDFKFNTFKHAQAGDTITVLKDCMVSGTLEITADNITLKSEDAGNPMTISREEGFSGKYYGTNTDTVLLAVTGGSLTTQDIIFDGGAVLDSDFNNSGKVWNSPLIYVDGSYVMEGGTILQNNYNTDGYESDGSGRTLHTAGALHIVHGGSLTMDGGLIQNCYTAGAGGGIQSGQDSQVTAASSTIRNCYATWGGGVELRGSAELSNMTFTGNAAGSTGGGISSSASLTVTDCLVEGNRSAYDGGGIYTGTGHLAHITGCTITGNMAGRGSAVQTGKGEGELPLVIRNCTIDGKPRYRACPSVVDRSWPK